MTAEEKVKQAYPSARIEYGIRSAVIMNGNTELGCRIGCNRADQQAWADAWRKIQKAKESNRES